MDVLHELVSNMSMAERSYFKRYAAKLGDGGAANYIHLFDAIAAQQQYDEAAIKKKFAGQKFIKQLSVAKTYLYKTVIKALRNFYEEADVQAQLKNMLLELAVLMDKGIYSQARKVIAKGLALSAQFEMFNDRSEFLTAELYLLMNNYGQGLKGRSVDMVMEEHRRLNLQIQNLAAYEHLYQKQHRLNKAVYQLRDKKDLEQYALIFSDPSLASPAQALSARAMYSFHFIRALHFSVTDNRSGFLNETKKLVTVCMSAKHFTGYDLRSTMNALNLLLEATYFNGEWAAMNKALKQLKGLMVRSERDKIAQFIYYSRFALIYFDQQKNTKEKLKLIADARLTFVKYEQKIPYHVRISTMVTYCSALLEMGAYNEALDWVELYRQGKKEDVARFDSQAMLLMMQLIAHYELGNHLLVKNIVPNIARFIKKVGQQSVFEKIMLSFFNQLTSSKLAGSNVFEETLAELNALKEGDILNRNRTMHDIFRVFIESKKAGKKYHQFLAA